MRNFRIVFPYLAIMVLSLAFISSCSDEPSSSKTWTVTWDANGGSFDGAETSRTTSQNDTPVVFPQDNPTRQDHEFVGYFTEKTGGEEVKAHDLVKSDVTYFAHWRASDAPSSLEVEGKWVDQFVDRKVNLQDLIFTVVYRSGARKTVDPSTIVYEPARWGSDPGRQRISFSYAEDSVTIQTDAEVDVLPLSYTISFPVNDDKLAIETKIEGTLYYTMTSSPSGTEPVVPEDPEEYGSKYKAPIVLDRDRNYKVRAVLITEEGVLASNSGYSNAVRGSVTGIGELTWHSEDGAIGTMQLSFVPEQGTEVDLCTWSTTTAGLSVDSSSGVLSADRAVSGGAVKATVSDGQRSRGFTLDGINSTQVYKVTWDGNGGTLTPPEKTYYKYNENLVLPTGAEYLGKILAGYYTASSGGSEVTTDTKVTSDVTYYAQWETTTAPVLSVADDKLTITNSHGRGTIKYTYTTAQAGVQPSEPADPVTSGSTYTGPIEMDEDLNYRFRAVVVFDTQATTDQASLASNALRGSVTGIGELTWHSEDGAIGTMQLSFVPEQGTEVDSCTWSTTTAGLSVDSSSGVLSADRAVSGGAVKATVSDGQRSRGFILGEINSTQLLKITFNANNAKASGSMDPMYYAIGSQLVLSKMVFSDSDSIYVGWNTNEDCSGDLYVDEQSIVLSDDLDLFAQWVQDATFSISQDGKLTCNSAEELLPKIALPSVVKGKTVTSIGDSAFEGCSALTSITIPEGVTSIGDSAFQGCSALTSITIPSGVTSIGDSAFEGCSALTSITIPSGVTSIGDSAFEGCSALTSITIPEGVNSIGDSAFRGCSSLTSITIPEGVNSIGDSAFRGCSSLTSITIPSGVTSIGDSAFRGCSSLTSITIPEGVNSIGDSAFQGCSALTSITIPSGVTSIRNGAFYGCSSLTSITIPEGVNSIGDSAFQGCSSLTSITIPSGVTFIGRYAFYGCSALTSITIPSGVTSIEESAFQRCSALTSITIPSGVTSIRNGAFYGCSSLTSITIPSGVTSIGDSAFRDCSSLTSITIPSGVYSIGGFAFYGCYSLTSITIPSVVFSIGGFAFCGCSSLTSITIPSGETIIERYAFYGCSSLTSITIPSGVYSIEDSAFRGCSALTSITIPSGVTRIGDSAFYGCSSLSDFSFEGTSSKWCSVKRGSSWHSSSPFTVVHCLGDGPDVDPDAHN